MSMPRLRRRSLPDATIARLPQYLRCLHQLENAGDPDGSQRRSRCERRGQRAVVRRDLSYVGSYGTRGVGYPVSELRESVNVALGLAERAPHGHRRDRAHGPGTGRLQRIRRARVAGRRAVRRRPRTRGWPRPATRTWRCWRSVRCANSTGSSRTTKVAIGVIATPAAAAQSVADQLVQAGVTSLLNLSAVHMSVPDHVVVRPVDLATEIQILAVHAVQKAVPMSLLVVGVSHHSAPMEVLEKVAAVGRRTGAPDARRGRRAWPRRWCCRPATGSRSTPRSPDSTPPSKR